MLSLMLTMAAQEDPWLGNDKLLHFGATAVISACGYAFGAELGDEAPRFLIGAGLGLAAAAAKELLDLRGGDPSYRDFIWSAGGTAAGLLVAWLIDRWLSKPDVPIFLVGDPGVDFVR